MIGAVCRSRTLEHRDLSGCGSPASESSGRLAERERSDRRCLPGTTPHRQTLIGACDPRGCGSLPAWESVAAIRLLAFCARSRVGVLNASSRVEVRSGVHPAGGARRVVCAGRSRPDAPAGLGEPLPYENRS